jgi:hypothetical protein
LETLAGQKWSIDRALENTGVRENK